MLSQNILFLHAKAGRNWSIGIKTGMIAMLQKTGIPDAEVFFASPHTRVPNLWIKKPGTKSKWLANPLQKDKFFAVLDELIAQISPKVIVINDEAALNYITNKPYSLDLCHGSVYFLYNKIPCIVCAPYARVHEARHGRWMWMQILSKVKRWQTGQQRHEPKFTYTICETIRQLEEAEEFLRESLLISEDLETTKRHISVAGFTGLHKSGKLHSYGIPLINPLKPNGLHWETKERTAHAIQVMGRINALSIPKVFQNGSYDCAYLIKYRIPPRDYFFDTYHLWHSIWCEAPKKLNFISSILLDYCRYWKDESKGDTADQRKADAVPISPEGYARYLRYNLLDCYNTILDLFWMLPKAIEQPWILDNYVKAFGSQIGPAFCMSMTGARVHELRQAEKFNGWMAEYEEKLAVLRTMSNKPDFMPSKNDEVASLIYDVLGAQPVKTRGKKKYGERSVDENVLKMVIPQHPLFDIVINALWDCKKPKNNANKYGEMPLLNNRFMYQYGASKTKTWRYAGSEHQYGFGTNPQNMPAKHRDFIIADPGYIIGSRDYSQSDSYFVAFEAEELEMIKILLSDQDAHCVNAEKFYGIPYEKIYQGHKEEAEWTEHPTKGVRQTTKRIVHGTNYWMAAFTMYMHLGRETVIQIALRMREDNPHKWAQSQCVNFCDKLIRRYHQMYRRLEPWQKEACAEAIKNHNLVTGPFGHTHWFFGNIAKDDAIKREIAAFYGQNGTAGNIDQSLQEIYWKSGLLDDGLVLLFQTHDELTWQSPGIEKFHRHNAAITEIMEREITIKDRTFVVPTDGKVGLSWGKKCMMSYREDISYEELVAFDKKWEEKNYTFWQRERVALAGD